jgi:hypothetical protein
MRRLPVWLPALCLLVSSQAHAADAATAEPPLEASADSPAGVGSDAESDERAREEVLKLPRGLTPDPKVDEPPLVKPKTDTVAGHFALAGGASWLVPFGELEQGIDASSRLSQGHAFGLDLSFGVSRTVAIGGFGRMTSFGAPDACPSCSATGFVVGPFIRYHLVQGTRFDPWLLAGAGFRSLSIEDSTRASDYSGFEWLHLVVGGDWYATSLVGLGPWAELNAGTFGNHPDGSLDSATHLEFSLGIRLILDVPGK